MGQLFFALKTFDQFQGGNLKYFSQKLSHGAWQQLTYTGYYPKIIKKNEKDHMKAHKKYGKLLGI